MENVKYCVASLWFLYLLFYILHLVSHIAVYSSPVLTLNATKCNDADQQFSRSGVKCTMRMYEVLCTTCDCILFRRRVLVHWVSTGLPRRD